MTAPATEKEVRDAVAAARHINVFIDASVGDKFLAASLSLDQVRSELFDMAVGPNRAGSDIVVSVARQRSAGQQANDNRRVSL